MSAGKDAARDLRYGRRGGRWVPSGIEPGTGLAAIDAARERHRAEHRANPKTEANPNGTPPWPSDRDEPISLSDPDSRWCGVSWDGKARMAAARQAAGLPLDEFDEEALRRAS